jgi:transcriptional regulator with XRE-family HTH domain
MSERAKGRTGEQTRGTGSGSPPELDVQRTAIGNRLRTAREMAGLSQGQIARLMGLHRPSVSEAEAGRRRVSAEELIQFAQHYGVNIEWISGVAPKMADPKDARVELAARELAKLKAQDLDRVLQLLAALRAPGKGSR